MEQSARIGSSRRNTSRRDEPRGEILVAWSLETLIENLYRFARRAALPKSCQVPVTKKEFCFPEDGIKGIVTPSRLGTRGGRVVTDAGRDAVDAKGRLTSGALADGEVVWSWRAHAGAKSSRRHAPFEDDGGNQLVHRGATVLRGRPAIGRPQGWRETRPRLRRLKALTPSARRSVGLACARSWTEREKDALAQFTAKRRLGSHFWPRAIIVLRMTTSLRMQAISATFGSFPLAISR